MQNVLLINKKIGETPLSCIKRYQKDHPEYAQIRLGYAGRLDPMAEGLLLILVGEENKKKVFYENLDKTYEVRALLGVATDTYDVLGKIASHAFVTQEQLEKTQAILESFKGNINQALPPFSSYRIGGKPLFWWAREGKLSEIAIPVIKKTVYQLDCYPTEKISKESLQAIVFQKLDFVNGNFRQKEIRASWEKYFIEAIDNFYYVDFNITVSSGTYIRSLVHEMGQRLGCGALVFNLKRTKIGDFSEQK